MNLVWFLTIGTILSVTLGEFGHYPFGSSDVAVSLTDLLLILTLLIFFIWKLAIKKEKIELKKFIPLGIFWLAGLLSLFFSGNLKGGLYLLRFIFYSSSALLGYYLIKSKVTDINKIIDVTLFLGTLFCLIGFLQLIFYPNLDSLVGFGFDPHQGRLVSSFLDPNFAGALLNITFILSIFAFTRTKLKKYLVLAGVFLVAIILAFSRSAYLMLGVEVLIFGWKNYWKMILILASIFIILFFVFPKFNQRIIGGLNVDASASERFQSWSNGLIIFKAHPFLGAGFDNLRYEFEKENLLKVFSLNGGHSGAGVDSSLIFLLATEGILGFVSFLMLWFFWFKRVKSSSFKLVFLSIFIGLLIDSQFINSLFYPPFMLLIYLFSGVMLGES